MRILHLADRFPGRGGADAYLLDWMASYNEEEQRLLVGRGKGAIGGAVECLGICKDLASPQSRLKDQDRLLSALAWADQVHLHNVMNPAVLRLAVEQANATVIVQDHRVFCPGRGKEKSGGAVCTEPMSKEQCAGCFEDMEYGQRLIALTQERLTALKGAGLVVLSQYMASELNALGLPGAAVHRPMVPVGASTPCSGTHFLMGGRLVSHKGIRWGIQSWEKSGVEAPLFLAGAGPEEQACGAATPLGWLDPPDLALRLHTARALLFPARWQEPYGILGVEALAQGTPVILMKSGGAVEWAEEGVILIERGDVEGFAAAIRMLWENPEKALELGSAGKEWVRRFCSREPLYAKRKEWLYRKACDG